MEQYRMRKIDVQSPEDVRFLIENLSRAARAKIDLHLPTGAVDRDDELRKRVEDMVMEVRYCPTRSIAFSSFNKLMRKQLELFSTYAERSISLDIVLP
jgi:hypothetical protein